MFETFKGKGVKVFVQKDKDVKFSLKISKKKFEKVYNAILKIENDTISVKDNLIDGSFTTITLYDNFDNEKTYYASGLNSKSQNSESQRDFWNATKLIISAARLKMEDLIDYK
ncbi:hypothetical protein PFY10_20070 [Chryseobacterium daecheongense]|nr:hypothetical protein PFY10_20070 [Chryseobacterium daecheongense]